MISIDGSLCHRISVALLLLGIALIVVSWLPVGSFVRDTNWSRADSKAYGELIMENHQLGSDDTSNSGKTQKQLATRRKVIQQQLDSLTEKLEYAKSRPEAWSHSLFWSGVVLVLLGAIANFLCLIEASSGQRVSGIHSHSSRSQVYKARDN